ncbi:MAG: sigma-54-dependent Fis family transcriptional regulator [SAR324 cluster bacterium]|nr:sigma-54-dependent Fis family transcriptional regulator [SAR324 cluster bacterium]
MIRKYKLSEEEIRFYRLVSSAAFGNPFSEEWGALVLEISGCSRGAPPPEVRKGLNDAVTHRLYVMDQPQFRTLESFSGEDRDVMEGVYLFEAYYRNIEKFDHLIQEQIHAGDVSCRVNFGEDILTLLERRGIDHERAVRLFGLFYQIRRAYYFIDRALLGKSSSMKQLRRQLWNNVFTYDIHLYEKYLYHRMEDFSTIILGDTGTGKGTAAVAIGRSGFIPFDDKKNAFVESFSKVFTAINLSQFHEQLIESELFGHKKGAFTGAIEAHEGVFKRCNRFGAIFLDEIGEVSIPIQIKLLHVLQDRFFYPVGSHEKQRFSGRVIVATNKSLDQLREKGLFRDDFYYRLSSDVIIVPSLYDRIKEHPDELDSLIQHFLMELTHEESPELFDLVKGTLKKQLPPDYNWPGNVREVEQAIRRILMTQTYRGDTRRVASDLRQRLLFEFESGDLPARDVLSAYCALLYTKFNNYEEVARKTQLDRRTAKKYVLRWLENQDETDFEEEN